MATRRQKQLERKYNSYRRYVATEDVNYATHSSRSGYRSESVTSRTSGRGRSSSTEVSTASETRSLPVYIAIQDYNPDTTDLEAVPLEQGQIVEVLDNKNAASWLVRTKARPPRSGWVPGSYFETPAEYYKQRRRTRELTGNLQMTDEQEAIMKRDQVYHDLLRTEEDFVTDLSSVLENYVRLFEDPNSPPIIQEKKDELTVNLRELYNFHANVMLKGLQYYSDDPGKVGHTFIRLERDFDHHVHFYRQAPKMLKLIEENAEIREFLQTLSDKNEAGSKGFPDYIRQIGDRIRQYGDYFKEVIKYSARAGTSTKSMQKALELLQSIPKRADDCIFTDNIQNYPGDRNRLGRIYRHDVFQVWEGEEPPKDKYIFLFKNKLMMTDKNSIPDPPSFNHSATIRLEKYTVRVHTNDDDTIVLRPNEQGLPSFRIKAKDAQMAEVVRKAWLKDINEMQEDYLLKHPDTATSAGTGTNFDDVSIMSDVQSEFSEYSNFTRKSSTFASGPEEGPARKKIKSPPGISPTASSTSLYSGGSSIDWTTTGTTLEMQGTRVTRTQYGFRTLQESSAKMCLKVTGYPLPEITWYKDDQLLKEGERHTFYADDDGFFALTIDPVQVSDTGRYTCVATNEYGQASTSAFFRVLKVEKEAAPPAFTFNLKDQEVKEGEVVSFECEVEGWPEPELVWMVDDQPLRPSQDFKLQYDGQKAKLEIRDAQPEDTGSYAVKISNEYGTLESAAKLVVQADPDKNHVPPEFQAVIEDNECNEGDTVRFKAVITGDPDPEITWLVNGIPLTESEKIKFISEDGICIVTIKDVSRHFDGTITCQGKNRLGTQTCDARLRVNVPPAAPTFEKPLEDRVITEKSAVMFECAVDGFPDPKVEFFLNGKVLTTGVEGVEILQRDNYYRVTVNNTSSDKHDGELVAKASNNLGQAESRAKLSVEPEEEESRSAPTFIKDIDDKTVKFGETAKFVTTVRGNPNPSVSWFINGQKLEPSTPGITLEANGADHSLTVDSSKHAGTVLCRAENTIGRFETKAVLIVLPVEKAKKAPEFVEKLQDKSGVEGGTVVFEARIDGEPKPQLKWLLNGQEVKENNRIKIREFDGSIKLEISDIQLSESGTIKCVATNSEGESSTEAVFTVTQKPVKPQFSTKPKNVSVERGQEAVFTCKVDASPKPEIVWSVGGRKVRQNVDFARVETSDDGTSKLVVDTGKIFENATISVTAENSQGLEETGALLNVEQPKDMAVIRDLKDQTVQKGTLAHFEAVIQNAKSVQWTINGQNLTPGQEGVKISEDMKEFEFRLTLDTNIFKGPVSIKASNSVETIEKKALLVVTEKPREEDAPKFTDQLKDVTAELGKPLTVDVIALNEPKFKWTLNGQPLEDGKNGVHILTDGNKSSLKIDQIKPEHAGLLGVTAENEAGRKDSSATLTVGPAKSAAKITEGLKSATVTEKESVEFSTTVSGSPDPSVKWFINEKVVETSEEHVEIRQSGSQHSLRINQVTSAQNGSVKVEVKNSEGTDTSTAELSVKKAEVKPKFKATLTDAKVAAGEPMTFNVDLEDASPNTNVNWYLNNKKLEESDAVKITDNGNGQYKLEIKSASPDMNGTLTVRAENSQGSDESKSRIEVTTGERKPEFSKTPQDGEVDENQSVKFSAIITGVPEPEITWYLNDQPITSNEAIRVKRDADTGKSSIRIFKSTQDQSGKVKVKASNKLGTIESTAELKVSKKREIPHFSTELSDRQVNEGSDAKFQVKIDGFPDPEVEWTLNGKPITADNVKTSQSGNLFVIEFNKVQLNQAGELAVEAKNSIGTKKENCTLAVKETGIAPNFTMNLTDRLVEEMQTLIMEAQLNKEVKPKPEITWFKDGQPLTDSRYKTSYDESNGVLKLSVAVVEPTDKSRITIKAENKWGMSETSASIGVTKKRPMAKPQFLSELAPITVAEGDSLNAKVIITGDPKPQAKWYVNNQLVAQTEDTELKEENGVYSMTIHGCTPDMSGTIKCVAVSRMGEISTEGKLTVIQPVPVEFETSLCDATCREGDTLKLKAVLLGEPTPVVSWYINGKKLEESQNIKIHADKGTYTVTIKDITTDYSGKVVCEAINEFGKASSEATLLVLPRGIPPDFQEWLSNIRARNGSKVVHKVVFTGDPTPVLTWYINNKEVKDGLEGISIKTDDKTSVLTIHNFNPEKHVGEIICKAENDAGEVSATANMITYTSDMISESESEAMAEDVGMDDLTEVGSDNESVRDEMTRTPTPVMAPKFITKIKDTKANKGHQAIFECVVPDTKGVVCKWLKDGKEIELLARIRVQSRTIEGHVTNELIIDDVKPEDAGKYTVIVENTSGKEVCEANLTVLESLEKLPSKAPEFMVSLQDKQSKTDDRVTFECKVVGEPAPQVKWFKDDQQVFEESRKIVIESDEGVQRLVIEKAQKKDTGVYKCVAENTAGQTSTEAKLEVRASEPPEFIHSLSDKVVKLGEQVSLECSVRGVPQPVVDFYRVSETGDKVKLQTGGRVSIQQDSTATHWRVVISRLERFDIASYKAEARNDAGTAISGAKVTEFVPVVEAAAPEPTVAEAEAGDEEAKKKKREAPESTPGDKQQKLKDGGEQEMSVEVTGNRPPEGPQIPDRELSKTPEPTSLEGPDSPAKIIDGLHNVSINEGGNVELTIKCSGKPYPQVTWLKNGEPVAMDGEHLLIKRLEDNVFKLILNRLKLDDEATYTAKASNKLGRDETSGKLTVNELVINPTVEKLKDSEVKEGDTVEFKTTVTGKPTPTVEWFKNNVKIIESADSRIVQKIEGNVHFLTIKNAVLDDSSKYTVKATNKGGADDSTATVSVKEDLEPPKFTDGLKSREIKEGQFSELSVSVSGKPYPEVKWFKDGKEVIPDGVRIIGKASPEYGYHSLTIKNAVCEDSGVYTAKASNKAGVDETSAKFKVNEDLERPVVTSGLISRKIKEGQTTELVVTVTGRPRPEVKWFKDGQEVFPDGVRISTRVEDDGKYKLIIKDARLADAGNYLAKAVNKAGWAESKADLEVVEDLEPPVFAKKPEPLELTEGQEGQLVVEVTGKPEPKIEWFKNGQPITVDGVRILEEVDSGGKRTLIIKDSKQDDTGTYSVKATNKVSSVGAKAKVYVGEHTEAPRFTEKLKDLKINQNETAVFECTVVGKPKPDVNWFKDGRPVFVDGKRIFEAVDEASGRRVLKIQQTKSEDVGTYSCQAVNKVGASSTKCELKLIGVVVKAEPPRVPSFTQKLTPQEVVQGQDAVFECKVDETTKPEIAWFKDGKPVKESDNVIIQHLPDGTVKLVIKNAKPDDVGTYKVEASNPAGKVDSEAPLKLQYAEEKPTGEGEGEKEKTEPIPRFEVPLHAQTVKPGETASFEAKVQVYSQPEVKWFKDDKPVEPSGNVKIEQYPDGTLKLTVVNAKPGDVGTYRVEVKTRSGQAQSEAPLRYADEKAVETPRDESEDVKPMFTQPLRQQAVKEGDTVTFECKVNESSHPEIQWFRDGVAVDSKPNVLIEHRPDGTLKLTIRKVKAEDIGNYRCEAVNRAGKADTEAPLKYAQLIDIHIPGEEQLVPFEGDSGEEGQFDEMPRAKVVQDKTTTAVETIGNIHAEYVVIQDDIEPLKPGMGAPEFVQLLRSALTSRGGEAVLKCRVKGAPRPTIKWTKQGKEVDFSSSRLTSEYLEDGSITLTIRNAEDSDAGEYRCEASNDYGSAWTEAPVILAAAGTLPKDGEAPDFLEPVRPVTVKHGQTAVLQGRICGVPEPSVKWYKGGKEIQSNDKRYEIESTSDGLQKLILKESTFEDVGEYRCEITNKWGDAFSDATLTVHATGTLEDGNAGQIVPSFTKTLQETTCKEHEHLEFEVQVGGAPSPKIRWLKDDKPIPESDQRLKQILDADGTAKLIIDDAKTTDSGKYTCEASNDAGKAKTEAPLTVKKADEEVSKKPLETAPEFSQGLQPKKATEGEPVVLDCKVDGHPPPTVKWYKNGDELKPEDGVKIESNPDGTNSLTIDKVKMEDKGEYTVEATNNFGTAKSKAPLVVEPSGDVFAEKTLKLKKGLQDKQVEEGAELDLKVEVEGKPREVKWFKGAEQLLESSQTHMEKVTDEEYKLTVEKAALSDTGNYRVVLATDSEAIESSCQVTVTSKKPEEKPKDDGETKPSFKKGLTDQKVAKGAPLRLEVEVDGKPREVKWYKNGNELKPDGKKIKTEDLGDGKYALLIPEMASEDFGSYSVVVSNDKGSAESKANVSEIDGGDGVGKPEIVSGLKPVSVKPGERAAFEVETKGPVKQVKWYKNGEELKDAQTENFNGKKFRLVIPSAKAEDIGDYKVVVINDNGSADSSAPLDVIGLKPDTGAKGPIKFVKPLQDVAANKGDNVPLEIELDRKPKDLKWYKNGNEIKPGDKEAPKKISDTKYQLLVPDVDADGQFKVVATSDDDVPSDSSCALTVKLPGEPELTFLKPLKDTEVVEGEPAVFEVETNAKPKSVKWYKNGQEVKPSDAKFKIEQVDDTKYRLTIPKAAKDDAGTFKIVLENASGPVDSSAALTVKPSEPKLTFLKPLKDQEVVEGEKAVFEVETNAKPRSVMWYKNGQEIKPSDAKFEIKQVDDTKYRLTIPKASKDDAATFKVVLENASGPVDSSASLTVKTGAKNPPKISKGLEDAAVAKGEALIFEVKIDGDVDTVRWLKDGQPVEKANASAKIEKVDGNTYRLTIPKADAGDAGQYTVEAVNDGGKATSSAAGEVDEKPEIVKGLIPASIDEGDDQVFRVEVSKPVREVKWYKNGQELKPSAHFQVKQTSPKKFEMVINKAQLDDGATFKVVLSNKAGSCDSEAALEVAKPNVLKLVKGLTDCDVDEGQPLVLSCKIDGQPKSVKWFKNGKEVSPDEHVKLAANPATGEYSLTVDSSIPSDGAAYRVVFANEKGDIQTGAVAHVKPSKKKAAADENTAPAFISPLTDVDIEEGDALTLKCKISGQPQPQVKWFRNGEELKPSDRVTIRMAMDGTATLRVLDSKKSDAGQYKVTASNPSGTLDSSCKVGVLSSDELPCKPKFIIPLKSTDCPLGAKAEFNIKIRGVPKPTIRFQIDGRNLPVDGDRITVEDMHDGNWCLTIKDVRDEDFGTLRCVAENENGKDECDCVFDQTGGRKPKMRDEEGYPPRFNVPLWDRRVIEGQLMFIECHVDAKPRAEITWTFNGDELKPGQGLQIDNTPEGACRIKINEFLEKHIGAYKCFAKNEYGTADTIAHLNVELPKEEQVDEKVEYPPKFNPGLEDKSLNEGQSLSLECKVDAVPTAHITWYKDGLPVKASDRLKWTYDPSSGKITLSISDVRDGDDGAYRCLASNHLGATNTACMVSVKTKKQEVKKQGEEPVFVKGLVDKYVDRGESIELHCVVTGDPMPEIKWYRNGMLMRPSNRVSIDNAPDGNCKLTVKDVSMSDEGMYRCEAQNPHGQAKTQCTAHVQMSMKREKTPIVEGEMPKFVVPLEDSSVRPGGVIELECKVTGVPMPVLKWSKDGSALLEDNRFTWENQPEKGTYRLTIKNASLHDEGTYRAVATNESGSANTKSMIKIDDGGFKGGKTAPSTSPRITVRLSDVRCQEGQPLRLECKVEGEPTPEVVWYKDGEKVVPSDRIQLETAPDGTSRLIIPKATMDDDGLYRVIATNPAGSAVDKCTATVRRAPRGMENGAAPRSSPARSTFDSSKAPRSMVPLENVRIPETQPFTLKCKFVGEPKCAIKWFKDGERLYAYERIKLVDHDDGTCELIVEAAVKADAGMYRCVAENEFGSARTTCEVVVQLKDRTRRNLDDQLKEGNAPGFSIPLTMKRARPGESVVFECLPYGKPFPQIKWLKDGIELVPGDNVKIEAADDGTQKLTLDNVEFLTEGFYRCVATNPHGTASTKAELVLMGDRRPVNGTEIANGGPPEESKPRIRRGLYPMSIHQNNPVEMQVVAVGWPTPTVKWFKNGEEIRSETGDGARRTIWTDERGVHHCVIVNCQPEDDGDYSVVATNPLGEARTEGPLNVIKPRYSLEDGGDGDGMPFPPGFIRQLKNKHVFTKMPTIFDCLVVGHPPPTVEWYHNGKKIVPDGRTKIQVAGGGSHALLMMDTSLEDAGEYVAIAKNSHGTAQSSAILDVTVPHLDNIKFDGSFDVTPYLTEEYGFKKINFKSLPTPPDHGPFIKEVTGHYLTLSWIPTKRTPPRYPQVTYVIEIRELPDRDWTLLDYNIPEPVCKVRNLELGRSYQFRVRAENIYGISDPSPASPPSRLMAPPPPVMDKNKKIIPLLDPYTEKYMDQAYAEQFACAPWFSPGVVDKRYCAENDTMTIQLSFSGYPDPKIQWKFRGWDLDTTSPITNHRVHTHAGAETILTISGFSKANAGQYQCIATNQYGDAQQNIMIELADRPRFIQPLMDKTFSDGKPMKMDVRVEGSPFPELKWMKDWKPIVESSRIKFVQDGPYLCSMVITNPIWRDSGIYSVIAINPAGQATTSSVVTVEADGEYNDVQLPRKRVPIESRKIKEVYEIDSAEEKKAKEGAPFVVKDKHTEELFIAQMKPLDDSLKRGVGMHNILDDPGFVQYRHVMAQGNWAMVVYENADSYLFENLIPPKRKPQDDENQPPRNREEEVRIFVKQLLTALQYLHHRNIVHLDLRPEVVLLQDDHLKLADFGQSRHLLAGKAKGEIQGTPEFVAPEVAEGTLVTLAADMWSAGVLTYVLLTGLSPFLGDNDDETIANVIRGEANFNVPELTDLSPEGKDFLNNLLQVPQIKRLSVDQALLHDWLNDPSLADAKLSTDCLREFKYKHKWLERRVFVQQSPSEQFTQLIEAPSSELAKSQSGHVPQQAEPFAIYDYLRIKDTSQPPEVPDYDRRGRPQRPLSRNTQSPDFQFPADYLPPGYAPTDQFDHQRGPYPPQRSQSPQGPPIDPRKQRGGPRPGADPRDPFGGRIPTPEELKQLIEQHLPPGVKYPPGIKPEDLLFVIPPPYGQDPRQLQQQGVPSGMPALQRAASGSPQADRKRLQPQEKGETPAQNGHKPSSKGQPDQDKEKDKDQPPPARLVRGERRDIEEEIANRILSDISEENSVAGSLASMDDFEPMNRYMKDRKPKSSTRRSRSRSSTPQADNGSEGSITPLASPPIVDGDDPLKKFFGDKVPNVPEFDDPSVPVGAPVFIDGLGKAVVTMDPGSGKARSSLSPRPKSGTPGKKSPITYSPGREHQMEVIITTKRGKQHSTSPFKDSADPLKRRGDGDSDDEEHGPKTARKSTHFDPDFDDLMNEVNRIKNRHKPVDDDMEKYRPKNVYKTDDIEFTSAEPDVDDYPWESSYQIGPDTLLLATRGAEFNARVRDYRREIWGDGAPLVRQGFLGYRNQDITVRERRRFTDLLREDPNISKAVQQTVKNTEVFQNGAVRKMTSTNVTSVPQAVRKNSDGTFGAIFRSRLRNVCFVENAAQLTFTCHVIGQPAPEVSWYHHENLIVEDGRHRFHREGEKCILNILRPTLGDIGEYSCHAVNDNGKDSCSARLVTGDAPGRPGRPEVELSSDTEVLLTWEPPESNTFLEGIVYKVEARPAGDDDYFTKWTTISDSVDDEAALVKHLVVQGIYQFRVTAKNGFGWGIPSLTSRIIRTHQKGAPKLQQDFLRDQLKFTVVTMPVKKHKKDPGLTEISEEAEEEASEEELSADDSISSNPKEPRPINLETSEDPLSRFQLENDVYRGQYSLVRNAVDTKAIVTKHVVAKIRTKSREHPAELAEEFETLRASQHENVVTLFAAYERNNALWLFTERLYEGVFDRFCYPDYYNEEQIALTIRQLTAALHWIHFRGVIHMDVQPENVMFANKRSWVVKLIDFEEAQFANSDKIQKRKPANPEWAAPELLQPNGVPTVQTDVWGLGVICFTLLSGFHPFSDEGETPEEVVEAVCKQKCDPNLIPVQASQEALRFATWAIKKSPARRIRTDEALSHRWLANDKNMSKKRESIKYPSNRLRKTTFRTLKRPFVDPDASLAPFVAKRK